MPDSGRSSDAACGCEAAITWDANQNLAQTQRWSPCTGTSERTPGLVCRQARLIVQNSAPPTDDNGGGRTIAIEIDKYEFYRSSSRVTDWSQEAGCLQMNWTIPSACARLVLTIAKALIARCGPPAFLSVSFPPGPWRQLLWKTIPSGFPKSIHYQTILIRMLNNYHELRFTLS